MTQDEMVQALRQVVASEVIRTDMATLDLLARDALHPMRFPPGTEVAQPLCVVQPQSAAQVAAVMRLATQIKRPVIPIGGGSGLMGGAASMVPGIVLDLRQLNAIHIRPADRMADVGAGATIAALNRAAAPHGLMCGHDPWTVAVATVGGTISTNSLGYVGGKYGSMGQQVLGLAVVLPEGEILQTRGVEKSSTGPALSHLFIGAEGCLGVITQATLRLVPIPQKRILQSWTFADFDTGFAAINALFDLGLRPGLLDYGDEEPTCDDSPPATLMIGYEGPTSVAQAEAEAGAAICVQHQGQLQPEQEAVSFWNERHARGDAYAQSRSAGQPWRRARPQIDYLHVALPPSAVLQYRRDSLDLLQQHGFTAYQTGLWDNAGLFSLTYASTQDAMRGGVHEALLKHCQDLHGSMEYCHGVGARLASLMTREHGAGLDVLRCLKQSLDPHGILNPGKLGL